MPSGRPAISPPTVSPSIWVAPLQLALHGLVHFLHHFNLHSIPLACVLYLVLELTVECHLYKHHTIEF